MDRSTIAQLIERYAGEAHDILGFRMFLSPHEHLQGRLLREGVHEWAETAILPTFVNRGWTVCDVGANIGYYSLLLSRLVGPNGQVFAFEPNPFLREQLFRHIEVNRTSIEVSPMALGAEEGTRRFTFDPTKGEGRVPNFGAWSLLGEGEPDGNTEVRFTTLDAFVAERGIKRLNFIKADIEGGELDMLRGASTVLATHRPHILFEFTAYNEAELGRQRELCDLLQSKRYTICRIVKRPWPHITRLTDADLELPVQFNALAYFGSHPIHP